MVGIEEIYCNTAISAALRANSTLLESSISDALQDIPIYRKGDTLGLDAKPEISIAERIRKFDQYAVLVTEERGQEANPMVRQTPDHERGARTFFVADPTDRSAQLSRFIQEFRDGTKGNPRVLDAIDRDDAEALWESQFGSPVAITGACSAITCVRRGLPICAVLMNYVTQQLTVACSAGIYHIRLGPYRDLAESQRINLDYMRTNGQQVHFRHIAPECWRRFVTFLGKRGYRENFLDSKLVSEEEMQNGLHYDEPGGPSRVLYLSDVQSEEKPVGFIVANGEKIGEWIHWLPFIRYGTMQDDVGEPALQLFEIFQDRPWTKDGVLMSTPSVYSIFQIVDPIHNKSVIDVSRLQRFPNPSKYRSTLLVAPSGNDWAMQVVQQYGHREIEFFRE